MMRFNDVYASRECLANFDSSYESYAAGMWTLGIRNTEMIAQLPLETLTRVLELPGLMHEVHASDMQARCKAAQPTGMFVLGILLASLAGSVLYFPQLTRRAMRLLADPSSFSYSSLRPSMYICSSGRIGPAASVSLNDVHALDEHHESKYLFPL